jgi:hypothetical protein
MASKVSICNLALSRVGHGRSLSSFDELTAEGNYARQFYDVDRMELLRKHPWNFAVRVVALAASDDDPVYGYLYRYQLPSDCIRPLELTNLANVTTAVTAITGAGELYQISTSKADNPQVAYRIVGRELMTNMENAKLAYVSDEENPNNFSDSFIAALTYRLAADFAAVIVRNANMQQSMLKLYLSEMMDAKGIDASENKAADEDTILSVRG